MSDIRCQISDILASVLGSADCRNEGDDIRYLISDIRYGPAYTLLDTPARDG